jgi:hypothetical protein
MVDGWTRRSDTATPLCTYLVYYSIQGISWRAVVQPPINIKVALYCTVGCVLSRCATNVRINLIS